MDSVTPLQLFLVANVLVIGVIATLAVQHAAAHYRQKKPRIFETPRASEVEIPADFKKRVLEAAQANYLLSVKKASEHLESDLDKTSEQLTKQLVKQTDEIIEDELKRYRADLDALRVAARSTMNGSQKEVTAYQEQLKVQLAADIAEEKAKLISLIDERLSDAMSSFLLETLKHNVDLGAQTPYLVSLLEEHKAELKAEVQREV